MKLHSVEGSWEGHKKNMTVTHLTAWAPLLLINKQLNRITLIMTQAELH